MIQDLEMRVGDDATCRECGDLVDAENVSVEAFERGGHITCTDCYEALCEWDDDDD